MRLKKFLKESTTTNNLSGDDWFAGLITLGFSDIPGVAGEAARFMKFHDSEWGELIHQKYLGALKELNIYDKNLLNIDTSKIEKSAFLRAMKKHIDKINKENNVTQTNSWEKSNTGEV